jgi:hypothetical protein
MARARFHVVRFCHAGPNPVDWQHCPFGVSRRAVSARVTAVRSPDGAKRHPRIPVFASCRRSRISLALNPGYLLMFGCADVWTRACSSIAEWWSQRLAPAAATPIVTGMTAASGLGARLFQDSSSSESPSSLGRELSDGGRGDLARHRRHPYCFAISRNLNF